MGMTGVSGGAARQLKVIATGGLGDCLLLTPFLRHFRRSGRYDRIVCATYPEAVELFDTNPHLDQVLACDEGGLYFQALPEPGCDLFSPYLEIRNLPDAGGRLQLLASPLLSPNGHDVPLVRQVAAFHGIPLGNGAEQPEIFPGAADRAWARAQRGAWPSDRPVVLVAPESSAAQRRYPRALWRRVFERLHRAVYLVELSARPGLQPLDGHLPYPRLRRAAALFAEVDCLLAIDSFPAHLAHAVDTPAVVLWGASNPHTFGHPSAIHLRAGDCPPCTDSPRAQQCRRPLCLEAIDPERVAEAVLELCRMMHGLPLEAVR